MRIGHYMTAISERGGVALHIQRLAAAQRAAGHEVVLFDLKRYQDPAGWPDTVHVSDERALLEQAMRRVDVLHTHVLVESAHRSPVPIIRTAHNHEPVCPSGGLFLGRQGRACERTYNPIGCALAHLIDRCGSARPKNVLADIERTVAERRATRGILVIAVSEDLRQKLIAGGHPPGRVYTLLPPAPERGQATDAPDGPVRFVFLGRLTPHKGVDWLLRAAATAHADFSIDIAGAGNAMDDLQTLSNSLGISNRVRFHGWLEGAAVDRLLDASRALIFPSLWPEPAGLVAFDAMARARAVIASRIGGIPELVGSASALLMPPGDVSALAQAIDRLAGDISLSRKLGWAGYERVGQFSVDMHLRRLHELYDIAIADHKAARSR